MVFDSLAEVARYATSFPGLAEAADFARGASSLAPGRYELAGGNYALVQAYETLDASELAWEAHRNFADVQIMLEGRESMGWGVALEDAAPYDAAKDAILAPSAKDASEFSMTPGLFVLFVPGEAHRPKAKLGSAMKVRKLVVKLRMN